MPSTQAAPHKRIDGSGSRMMGCLALSPEQRFPKSSKFTDSIVLHGRWENNTLDEATNLRQREHRVQERTKQRMKQVSDKFRGEMKEVEIIQEIVRMRQHRLARANLHACCAVMIQVTWRRYRARNVARERRGKVLARMLLRLWRSYKTRRSLAIIQRFVSSLILERAELTRQRSEAAATVQKAWKHRVARCGVHQVVVASAAIEVVTVNILADLAEMVYLNSKADVISRVWRRLRVRPGNKHRKAPRGRAFLTQGGASPRRKPRPPSSRGGLPSDPSMSPRGGASSRGKSNNTSPSTTVGARPMVIAVIAAAATVAPFSSPMTTGTAPATMTSTVLPVGSSNAVSGSEQQQHVAVIGPSPECLLLRHSSASSPENETSRRRSRGGSAVGVPEQSLRGGGDNAASRRTSLPDAAATTTGSREELGQAVSQRQPVGGSSSAGSGSRIPPRQYDDDFRPPYASVAKRSGSRAGSVDFAGVRSGGGGCTAVGEDSTASCTRDSATRKPYLPDEKVAGVVEGGAAAAVTPMQPRRPNDVRRSKLLEGRPRIVVVGEQETQDATINIVVENDAAIHAPIDDTAISVLNTEAVMTVDNVSATIVSAEASSTEAPLPEVEGRGVGFGRSRSDVSGGEAMVATSVERPKSGVDATLLAVALDCHAKAEASCTRRQGSKSEESWTENYVVDEYASDLFESDSHISLPP